MCYLVCSEQSTRLSLGFEPSSVRLTTMQAPRTMLCAHTTLVRLTCSLRGRATVYDCYLERERFEGIAVIHMAGEPRSYVARPVVHSRTMRPTLTGVLDIKVACTHVSLMKGRRDLSVAAFYEAEHPSFALARMEIRKNKA